MKRVNISLSDETYEALRKQAFEAKVQPGTLAARMVVGFINGYRPTVWMDEPYTKVMGLPK